MTRARKRFIKLMMSIGYSRNQADKIAAAYRMMAAKKKEK